MHVLNYVAKHSLNTWEIGCVVADVIACVRAFVAIRAWNTQILHFEVHQLPVRVVIVAASSSMIQVGLCQPRQEEIQHGQFTMKERTGTPVSSQMSHLAPKPVQSTLVR